MTGLMVLVTGVTRFIGSTLAGRLAEQPGIYRVIGVDATLPEPAARSRMGGAEFARADIRNPLIARVIDAAGCDTVVHASASASPASSRARTLAKEMNVLGTMQLLAACQRAASVKNLIVRSTTAVYGSSPRDPAVCTEATEPRSVPVGDRLGTPSTSRVTSGVPPPPARRAGAVAAVRRGHRAHRSDPADQVLHHESGDPDAARPGFAAAVAARVRRGRGAAPLHPVRVRRHRQRGR